MKCLEDICLMNNLKCKECKILDCKKDIQQIEEKETIRILLQKKLFIEKLEKKFPLCIENNSLCSHLEILKLEEGKVRCPYMIRKKCILKKD